MADTIIKVENLSKKFTIGAREPYYSLRDQIASLWSFKNKKSSEEFWALKDLNFEIKRGEVVGIIGRNGAGKSTLLKILSQITPPTTGKITMKGRVASLLEVGTGFNQELTGRENIFLNGAILGLSRDEIKRKFDEIVAFSEVEKFLDTPVKRYSSGMYVRLAFAIAANLEPEILIVDEVLAVGDAQFQKKCLGKMDEVSKKDGRTVLFVSHNMAAIKNLCNTALFIDRGKIKYKGPVDEAINLYSDSYSNFDTNKNINNIRKGSGEVTVTDIQIFVESKKSKSLILGKNTVIRLKYNMKEDTLKDVDVSLGFDNRNNERVALFSTKITGQQLNIFSGHFIDIIIPKFPLVGGSYRITWFISSKNIVLDWVVDAASVDVIDAPFYENGDVLGHQSSSIVEHQFRISKS